MLVVAGWPCTMRPSFLPWASRIQNPAGAAAIDVAGDVDLHAVGHAGLAAAQVGEHPVALLGERAVGLDVEGADMAAAGVVDIEHALVRREREPVGEDEIIDEEAERAEVGREAIDAGEGQVPLLGRGGAAPRIGEIDRAVGLDHHVVGPVETPPLEAVREHGETAVELAPRHPPGVVLAREQPALQIAREPVGAIARLEVHGRRLPRHVLHPAAVVDVGEQQEAALLPPQRPLGRPERPAETGGEFLDRLVGRDDLVQLGRKLLDARARLRDGAADTATQGNAARGRGHRQHASARDVTIHVHGKSLPCARCVSVDWNEQ